MEHNISNLLETVADAIPDTIAVAQGDVTRTWAELDGRASRLAGYLAAQGVTGGSVVALGLRNRIEHIEAILAVTKLRAVPANLNYRYLEQEIEYVLADCAAVAVIAEPEVVPRVLAVRDRLPSLSVIIEAESSPRRDAPVASIEEAIAKGERDARRHRTGDDRFLIYTGGTTGMPKATDWRQKHLGAAWAGRFNTIGVPVPGTLDELAATVRGIAGSDSRLVTLPASPLIHAVGLHASMGTLVTGGTVVFAEVGSFDPAAVWRAVARNRVTYLAIVGDVFARPLLAELRTAASQGEPYDVSSVNQIGSSGTIWSADVKAGLLEFVDAKLMDVLASSEGGPFAVAETVRGKVSPTSRFTLAPLARLIDEDDRDVEPGSGKVGLLAAGGIGPVGYAGDEAKTAATFRVIDGVRYTVPGDRAMLEADGTVVLLGRESGIINTGGEKVFAEEVEAVLAAHPAVDDVLVTAAPDERWGSIVAAVVQTSGSPVEASELSTFVKQHLASYKQPRRYVFVPRIHRSPAGKADRKWAASVVSQLDSELATQRDLSGGQVVDA